jgi:hypothetical protein
MMLWKYGQEEDGSYSKEFINGARQADINELLDSLLVKCKADFYHYDLINIQQDDLFKFFYKVIRVRNFVHDSIIIAKEIDADIIHRTYKIGLLTSLSLIWPVEREAVSTVVSIALSANIASSYQEDMISVAEAVLETWSKKDPVAFKKMLADLA